ncbi:uncharacterized protein [Epargyreus clarus]|uniref:uncharacterized protein n=1 Tax=Epargyreus clarus TaxID=520877 RepID=UPI003C2D56FA
MSYFVQEIPKEVTNATPAENTKWSLKMKIFAVICAFITYILLLMSAKTIYAKTQRLDKMDEMVLKTEEMMHNLHTIDRNLAIKLERIENMVYDDYEMTVGY